MVATHCGFQAALHRSHWQMPVAASQVWPSAQPGFTANASHVLVHTLEVIATPSSSRHASPPPQSASVSHFWQGLAGLQYTVSS